MKRNKNFILGPVLSVVLAFFFSGMIISDALAHKVVVFAWVEKGSMHIQGSFGSKKKAKNCKIIVRDENKTIVHNGQTGQDGTYTFKLPPKIDKTLIVSLDAGSGHLGSWTILKEEISANSAMAEDEITAPQKDIAQKIKNLEQKPSLSRIMTGVAIIFGLALITAFLRKIFKKEDNNHYD